MNLKICRYSNSVLTLMLIMMSFALSADAQNRTATVVLTGAELNRVVPTGFYFEGQSAPTQMRNSAAARLAQKRNVVAGIVDTSGYSTDIRAKYEGFLITDSSVEIGGQTLSTGAYGFGFTDDGKFNVFDVGGNQILSVASAGDRVLRRPRPLMMAKAADGLRLYSGRSYVVVAVK
jgi:hypothetical protein